MPNLKKHLAVAAGVGGGANLLWQLCKLFNSPNPPKDLWETLRRIDYFEMAAFAAIGGACGALPDIIASSTFVVGISHSMGFPVCLRQSRASRSDTQRSGSRELCVWLPRTNC